MDIKIHDALTLANVTGRPANFLDFFMSGIILELNELFDFSPTITITDHSDDIYEATKESDIHENAKKLLNACLRQNTYKLINIRLSLGNVEINLITHLVNQRVDTHNFSLWSSAIAKPILTKNLLDNNNGNNILFVAFLSSLILTRMDSPIEQQYITKNINGTVIFNEQMDEKLLRYTTATSRLGNDTYYCKSKADTITAIKEIILEINKD